MKSYMKKLLLMSAAAILIAGAGPAFTQGHQGKEGAQAPERAPAAQQSAPAEKIAPPVTTGQGQSRSAPEAAQAPSGHSRSFDAQDMKKDAKPETTGQAPAGRSQTQTRDPVPSAAGVPQTGGQTTGQGAASTSSSLTGEQRSRISVAIKQQNAQPVTKVNFTVAIGTSVPQDIRRMPLPVTVIEVYPAWRGYEYIHVGDEILVIDPATLRIVAIIEA